MQDILTKNILREKRRSLLIAIAGAILVSSLVLAASFGLEYFNSGNTSTTEDDGFDGNLTLELNQLISNQFENDHIVQFEIGGNATASIHDDLIFSAIERNQDEGNWNSSVIVEVGEGLFETVTHDFTENDMLLAHNQFLDSLSESEEVQAPPGPLDEIQFLVIYIVLFDDNTGLEFGWARGSTGVEVMIVNNLTWEEMPNNFLKSKVAAPDTRYIGPADAFDPFLETLQDLFSFLG